MAGRLRHFLRDQRVELAIYLILVLTVGLYARGTVRASEHRQVVRNCLAVEGLKAVEFQAADAGIQSDLAFLLAHPHGTTDISERLVRADIAAKEITKTLSAPLPCPKL